MNSKLMRIMAIGVTTLFLSAPAFACAGAQGDRDVGMTDQYLTFDESLPSDQDMNKDQGNYNSDESANPTETGEPSAE